VYSNDFLKMHRIKVRSILTASWHTPQELSFKIKSFSCNNDTVITQIASQYLNSLLVYQTSSSPSLADPNSPQHYVSTALILLNYLSINPDISKRLATHPLLLPNIITQLVEPDFVSRMKAVPRTTHPGSTFPAPGFDADFGSLLQFVSTILLHVDDVSSLHPRIRELIPKLKGWKREFRGSSVKTISNAAERLVGQVEGMDIEMLKMMRGMQENHLVCGVVGCGVSGSELTVCKACRVQRYCGRDHQKADWKYHKHICDKGLVEPEGN
jgi:hypothetical protein